MLWATIPGYENFYEVSDQGDVRSLTRKVDYGRHSRATYKGRELKQFWCGKYLGVKLSKYGITKSEYVHELVLLAFEGPRPRTEERGEIRHLDGVKTNNALSNLAYGTAKENRADFRLHKAGVIAVKETK